MPMSANATRIQDLVNPQVMADMISAQLPNQIRFSPLATVDRTLEGRPGSTITVPKWAYIGDAADVAEGADIPISRLTSTTAQWTIKKAGKAVELTDESVLSGMGDPLGEAAQQLRQAIAAKVDNDCLAALYTTSLVHDGKAAQIGVAGIADALDKFGEYGDGTKVLIIHPNQQSTLRKDPDFIRASQLGDQIISTGVIGEIYGCQVLVSGKITTADAGGTTVYNNLIVKPGALGIFLKRNVEVETDRDILAKTTVISADQHYVAALLDESKVIKAQFKV